MRKILVYFSLVLGLTNCDNNQDVFKEFNCKTPYKLNNIETVLDAKNNFSLEVPKHWKTVLYLDTNSSMFTTADTTKQYLNTYLIKASLVDAKLKLNKINIEKIKSAILSDKSVKIISQKRGSFKKYSAFLLKTKSDKFKFGETVLHLYTPISGAHYFEIEIHCFGTKNIKQRFCEAFKIINTLKISEM